MGREKKMSAPISRAFGLLFVFSRFIYGHTGLSERETTRSLYDAWLKLLSVTPPLTDDVMVKFYSYFLYSSTVLVSRRRTPYSRETRPQSWSCRKSRFSSTRKFVLLKTGVVLVTQHASPEWSCVTAGKDVSHAWRAQRKSAKETGVCQSIAIPLIFIFARRFTLQAWTVTGISFLKARSVCCGTLIQ